MPLVLSTQILPLPAALIAGVFVALALLRLGRKSFSPRLFGVAVAVGAMIAFLPAARSDAPRPGSIFRYCRRSRRRVQGFRPGRARRGVRRQAGGRAAYYFMVRPSYERRTTRDLVLGVAAVALGFALIENILSMFSPRPTDGRRQRSPAPSTVVLIHALIGLTLGAGLARAEA